MNAPDFFGKFFSACNLAFTIFGTAGNIAAAYICLRESLRKTPTFIITTGGLLMDILPLCTMCISKFTMNFWTGFQINNLNLAWCRAEQFLLYWGLHASAFLLVNLVLN